MVSCLDVVGRQAVESAADEGKQRIGAGLCAVKPTLCNVVRSTPRAGEQ